MANGNLNVRTLHELYQQLGLSADYLEEAFHDLAFRPNYFSFLFTKSVFGHCTIHDQQFELTSKRERIECIKN